MKTIRIITIVTFLAFLNSCQKEELSLTETEENSATSVTEMESSETIEPELAFPGQQGEVINLTPGAKHPTIVEKFGDTYVLGGDIVLTEEQVKALSQQGDDQNKTGIDSDYNFGQVWPDGKVYYTIDPTLPDQYRVTSAISSVEFAYPYIEFIPRTSEPNYINFVPSFGCWSLLGMTGGVQEIGLSQGCSTGNTIHEIGHALGLYHEQSRADRDNYVNIHYDNIFDQNEFQFHTYIQQGRSGFEFGSYDFNSIMTYGSYAFSENGQPTITKLDNSTFVAQRDFMSIGDIQTIHTLYNDQLFYSSGAFYRMDGDWDDFGDVEDFGSRHRDLTNNGVIYDVSGSLQIPRNVAYFDGASYAEADINNNPILTGPYQRTISAYIKTTANNGTMVSWGSETGTISNKWAFKIQNGKIGVDVGNGYIYGSKLVNDGEWHHVACTYPYAGYVSDIKLYVDGGSDSPSGMQNAIVQTVNTPLRIGRDVGNLTDYFEGDMFDVFISGKQWPRNLVTYMSRSYDIY